MNYDEMSDAEINTAIKAELGLIQPSLSVSPELNIKWDNLDYCNNPSDAWPIIVENKIATGWASGNEWRPGR